jgi:flavin-dependent dehydrogenase
MNEGRHEVIVLGAGPAGSAAATLLARRSHDVVLVRPRRTPAGGVAQSVPPSARKLLAEVGLLEAVDGAGFHPNRGNTVWWAGGDAREEPFGDGAAGFHAERGELEAVLAACAESNGVHLHSDAAARSADEEGGDWVVGCEDAFGRMLVLRAPWLIDATGRHGLVARTQGRVPDRSTTTLAVLRRWRRPGGWPQAPHNTLLESYEDGWAWSLPLSKEVRCYTAMVDQRAAEMRGLAASDVLSIELAKAGHLFETLAGAEPIEEAWACPASLYTSRSFARRGLILAGDAGSCIDPLSSYGVKKALSSGWLAAVAVHTALTDPQMASVATDFYDEREREVYRSYRRLSAAHFEEAAAAHGHTFWHERAQAARAAAIGAEGDPESLEAEIAQERVMAAHERIRARERLDAVAGSSLRSVRRPHVGGHRIGVADHPASDAVPAGIRWVRGVDLAQVVRMAPDHDAVPDVWAAYNAAGSPVSLPDFLVALSTAFAAGLLEHRHD